ncbi:acyltransferase family protein [Egicoccus halophilus]|uniref:Acyltransferase n=1 Tax=Egicoccus halophilus TaxID=1670830 RepID=A0A8J3A9Y8_9ACTN|nr:acyltransferase family protein [Egicoccus halophilus]GGI05957.1 acyltransferase [Egicoccus halophilus]
MTAPSATVFDRPVTPRRFRSDIEGLRGIAVLLVMIYHAGAAWLPGGYVGVDVFFVLSGYLITRGLVTELERTGRIALPTFYARRFRRLLPASTLVLVTTVLGARVFASPMVAESVARDGLWSAAWLANYRFVAVGLDYLAADLAESPLLHFWSLAVEEQFYVLWPLLVLGLAAAFRGRGRRPIVAGLVVVTLVSFAWAVVDSVTDPTLAYLSLHTRAWELAAGALLALVGARLGPGAARLAAGVGLAAVVGAAAVFDATTTFPGPWALIPVLGTVAVLAAGDRDRNPLAPVLDRAWLQRTGKLSYSLYLWHWPVLVLTEHALGRPLRALEAVACLAASWLLAEASFALVEDPVRHSRRLAARPRNSLSMGASLAAGSLVLSLVAAISAPTLTGAGQSERALLEAMAQFTSDGEPDAAGKPVSVAGELDEALRTILEAAGDTEAVPAGLTPPLAEAGERLPRIYDDGCVASGVESPPCVYGDPAAERTLVLFGDSHAAHWFPAFERLAVERGWRLVVLVKAGCPSADIHIWRDGTRGDACTTWREHAFTRLADERPELLVVSNASHYEAHTFEGERLEGEDARNLAEGQSRTTSRIHEVSPDTRVVAFGVSPRLDFVAPECLARNLDTLEACTPTLADAVDLELRDAQRARATADGIAFVDTTRFVCAEGRCPLVVGDLLVYWDTHHLTVAYAHWVTPALGAALFDDAADA